MSTFDKRIQYYELKNLDIDINIKQFEVICSKCIED